MGDVKGKRALVTGAARGIGLELAKELLGAGAEVVLVDRDEDALAAAAKVLGKPERVHHYALDVSDRRAVERMAQRIEDEVGPLDLLVNNAGIGHSAEVADTSVEQWERLMAVNFWGPLYLVYALLPSMRARGRGHVVNVSSGQAFFRLPTWGPYATSKAALGVMSEVLAFELRKHGIQVTTVYPYMVHTGFYDDVEAKTPGQKLSMKLLPYYSMKPDTVARIVLRAIRRDKRVEMVSPINRAGALVQALPFGGDLVGSLTEKFLARGGDASDLGRAGFRIDEVMSGWHERVDGDDAGQKRPMEFRVTWGPDDVLAWLRPSHDRFLAHRMHGSVHVDGLTDGAPCEGDMELRYFDDRTIRYTFDFEADGKRYRFVGEKVEIKPWNLPFSHTTCFGTIVDRDSGELVSRSVTRFHMRTLPAMLRSLRLHDRTGATPARDRASEGEKGEGAAAPTPQPTAA